MFVCFSLLFVFDVACLAVFRFSFFPDTSRERIPPGPGSGQLREAKPVVHAEPVFHAEDAVHAPATGRHEL